MQKDNVGNTYHGVDKTPEASTSKAAQQIDQTAANLSQLESRAPNAPQGGVEPTQQQAKVQQKLKKKKKTDEEDKSQSDETDSAQPDTDTNSQNVAQESTNEHTFTTASEKAKAHEAGSSSLGDMKGGLKQDGSATTTVYQQEVNNSVNGAGNVFTQGKQYFAANTHTGSATTTDAGVGSSGRGVPVDSASNVEAAAGRSSGG